jgi:hypothetical protein
MSVWRNALAMSCAGDTTTHGAPACAGACESGSESDDMLILVQKRREMCLETTSAGTWPRRLSLIGSALHWHYIPSALDAFLVIGFTTKKQC